MCERGTFDYPSAHVISCPVSTALWYCTIRISSGKGIASSCHPPSPLRMFIDISYEQFPADVTVRVSASKMRRSYRNTFARVLSDARNDAHKHEKEHTRNKRQPTDVARGTRARDASPKGREDSSAVCGSVSSRGYRSSHDGDGGRRGSIEEQRPSRTSREGSECGGSQGMVKDLAHVISAQYMRGHRYMKDTQGRGFSFIPQKY